MDGTLLNSNHQVSQRFLEQFQKLKERNIRFVAASGRQYHSMVDKLYKIKEDIIEEVQILPEQIATFKPEYHKSFLRSWLGQQSHLNLSFEDLWEIREACIRQLSS